MKIAIIGAGAIGGLIGGLLAEDNKDIVIVGRQDFVDTVKEKGLAIKKIGGDRINVKPFITEDISEIKDADAVLLAVKSQDTVDVCNSIKEYVGKDTVILSLQNGIRNESLIKSVLKESKVVRTVVMFNSVYINPGEISQGSNGPLIVENLPCARDIVDYINGPMEKAEIGCIYEDNIEGVIWSKLLFNLLNAIGASTNLDARVILTNPITSRIAKKTLIEGREVVIKSGKVLKSLEGKGIGGLIFLLSVPASIREFIMTRMFRTDVVLPSTLQSVLRGKKTEIDYLNGEIVNLAESNGMKAPVNKALVDAVKTVEQSSSKGDVKFFSPSELKEFIERYM